MGKKKQPKKPKLQYDSRRGKWTQSYNGEVKRTKDVRDGKR